MYGFITFLIFFLGASIGSFLNVCIYRIPRELSVVSPRSHCPHCKQMIPWYRNIPLFSYILLRGRCAGCGGRISPRYVTVELLVAVLFLLAWLKFPATPGGLPPLGLTPVASWELVPIYWLVFSGLVLGTFVDFEHLIIPDRVTLGGIVAGLFLSVAFPLLHGQETIVGALIQSGFGLALGWGILWFTAWAGRLIFRKEAMGFGDVKLLGAIGAFLGWRAVIFTLLLSSLTGAVVGLGLVAARQKAMQSRIPYGPYIALGAIIWILWGSSLWDLYWNVMLLPPAQP